MRLWDRYLHCLFNTVTLACIFNFKEISLYATIILSLYGLQEISIRNVVPLHFNYHILDSTITMQKEKRFHIDPVK